MVSRPSLVDSVQYCNDDDGASTKGGIRILLRTTERERGREGGREGRKVNERMRERKRKRTQGQGGWIRSGGEWSRIYKWSPALFVSPCRGQTRKTDRFYAHCRGMSTVTYVHSYAVGRE